MSKAENKVVATPLRRFQSICVFGGSNLGKDRVFAQAAHELGKELAARKINLVYGGGIRGLKGCVGWSAIFGGSKVLSVTLKDLVDEDITSYTLGTELKVSSIPERMGHMLSNAEAFIAIPGGLGTLEEISDIVSWANLNLHKKPLGLLNINGFYDGLLSFLDQAVEQGFIPQASRRAIISSPTVVQLIDQLQDLVPEPAVRKRKRDGDNKDGGNDSTPDTTLRL